MQKNNEAKKAETFTPGNLFSNWEGISHIINLMDEV